MYIAHYGLSRYPFQLTPDVRFFFDSRVHKRALATIIYGLSKQEGFVVVTGEVGAGKTTLIEYLLSSGDLKDVVVARVSTTQLEAENLLELIVGELEIRKSGASKAAFLRDLNSYFLRIAQAGKSVLLIVDEVQNLSAAALEELRMLSNFQDRDRPLVQMLLVGQPEFKARLSSPECVQLRQRVIASYHLAALTAKEVPVYIDYRMKQAGFSGKELFTGGAYQRIHLITGGVPRKINRLCDRLLLYGYLEDIAQIDGEAVEDVAAEMRSENLVDFEDADMAAAVPAKEEETAGRISLENKKIHLEDEKQSPKDVIGNIKTIQSDVPYGNVLIKRKDHEASMKAMEDLRQKLDHCQRRIKHLKGLVQIGNAFGDTNG